MGPRRRHVSGRRLRHGAPGRDLRGDPDQVLQRHRAAEAVLMRPARGSGPRLPRPRPYNQEMLRAGIFCLMACALVLSPGCAGPTLTVSAIQVGRSVNQDGSISAATTVFKPNDTIYVSVRTTDLGSGTITVRWSYGGRLLSESSKTVSYKIAADTEFHMQSPTEFPRGAYTVDILVDGK